MMVAKGKMDAIRGKVTIVIDDEFEHDTAWVNYPPLKMVGIPSRG